MTELKTLKDINCREDWLKKELKAEAIKWVNYMDKEYGCWIGRSFWMKRFNLIEEELNNEGKEWIN